MKIIGRSFGIVLVVAAGIAGFTAPVRGEAQAEKPPATAKAEESLADRWGIQITGLRLSARGNMVDFRYKVLDADKAATLSDRESKPYLLDQASGNKLLVPKTPKIGPLRQTAQKPEVGKVYFVLFANPNKVVKAGSKVTVALGDFQTTNLTVE